jgi:Spy/CpxP family protein refolding chaperone
MKTKTIALAIAGLSLTSVLMAGNPQGEWNETRGHRGRLALHQRGGYQGDLHRRARRGALRRMARQLDLTSDQKEKIREIFTSERKAKKAQRRARRLHEKQPRELFGALNPETFMSADHFDKTAFVAASEKQAADRKAKREAKRQARIQHRAAFLEKIFNVLTPEQRVKWIELAKH